MSYTIIPKKTPCLHCVLKSVPVTGATCDTVGIISPSVQIVAAYQVAEAFKILVEDYEAVRKTFLMFDIWSNQYHSIKLGKIKTEDCPRAEQIELILIYHTKIKRRQLFYAEEIQFKLDRRIIDITTLMS